MEEAVLYAAVCSPGKEHQAAWDLLALALAREVELSALPEVAKEEEGKPFFPGRPDICFNLSHSHGAVACAVHDRDIGVDIELVRQPPKLLGQGMEPEAFFRLWTAREATVKRRGQGIAALMRGEAPDPLCQSFSNLLPGWIVTVCPSVEVPVRTVRADRLLHDRGAAVRDTKDEN